MNEMSSVRPAISVDPGFDGCAEVFVRYAQDACGTKRTIGEGGVKLRRGTELPG